MRNEFKGANRVSDTLQIVTLTMRKIIHRIGIPLITSTPVRKIKHTVHNRVAEVHIGTRHINLRTKNHFAWFNITAIHFAEKLQTFFCGAVAIRTIFSWFGRCSFLCGNFFRSLLIYISLSRKNAPFGKIPKILKIVAGIANLAPLITEPLNVFFNGTYVFKVFLLGVGVIHTKVTLTAKFLSNAEVHCYCLCVTNMKITVGFRREARLKSSSVFTLCKVILYNLFYEVQRLFRFVLNFYVCHFL